MKNNTDQFFQYNNSKWHYHQLGNGKKALIAFHGYGQNGRMFEPIVTELGKIYTVYAFDFIYHGKTKWDKTKSCTPESFAEMLDAFALEKGLRAFDLMGFSMGGKILLHSLPFIKTPIDRIYPIAMDGVRLAFYHHPFLQNKWADVFVRIVIFNSAWTLKLLPALVKLRMVSKQAAEFMHYYFETKRRRTRAYMVWKSMIHFWFPLDEIAAQIEKRQIKTHIIFGKKDRILAPDLAIQLKELLPNATLHWSEGGHFIVDESLNPIIHHILAEQ